MARLALRCMLTLEWGSLAFYSSVEMRAVSNGLSRLISAPMAKFLSVLAFASTALAQPDLVVTNIVPPATGTEGGVVELSWTVTNQGDAAVNGDWSDSVFLSIDQVLSGDDNFRGAEQQSRTLAPGESYTVTRSVELPVGLFGDLFFIIDTDSGDNITEGDGETNNAEAADTATVIEGSFPDLVVEILEVPESGLSGEIPTGQLRWRVTNVGGTTAVATTTRRDRISISLDDQVGDDITVDEINMPSSLAPGESYERSASSSNIRLPYNINGEVRWRILTDAYAAFDEGDAGGEDNNDAFSDPYSVQGGDAQIADFVAPDLVSPGTRTTLTWRSTNPGPGTIANVYYSMWLSVDEIGGNGEPGERVVFTDQYFTGELDPGDSENESRTYDIPSDVVDGDYFFVLVADPQDEIDETVSPEGESNNVFARAVGVDSNVFPDLVVEILEVPESGLSGEIPTGQLRWRVTNVGGTTAVATTTRRDRISISLDDQVGDDITVDEINMPSSLAPGESYERSASSSNIRLPYNINGEVRWRILTDAYAAFDEGDAGGEDNNDAFSDPYSVQGGDAQIADFVAPDLVSPGTRTTLTWRSTNPGPGTIANVYYSMWLSVDEIGGNGEPGERVVFTDQYFTGELDPGDSENESRTYDIPSDVVDGDYFFVLVADPQDEIDETVSPEGESNNVFARAVGVDSNVFPDLVVEILEVPESGLSGEIPTGQLRWRVTNVGGTTAVATTTRRDRISISLDDQVGDDITVDEINMPSSLAPGESYERSASSSNIRLPYNINGEVRWRILTDAYAAFDEGDAGGEDNNDAFSDPYSVQGGDAQIADFVAPDLVSPGTRTTLTWRSTNPGPGTIANVYYSMWLSVDEIGGNGEPGERVVFTDQYFTGELDPGDSENESRTYDIPSDVVDGDYFFVLVADPQDEIDETVSPEGESNNVFARAVGVDSNVFPDLVVEILEVPESGLSGEIPTGQLRWRVTNVGGTTAVATTTRRDRISISLDDQVGDDITVDEINMPSSLAPGESYERSASSSNIRLPYNINGEVRWRILTDAYAAFDEGDAGGEDNNDAFSDPYSVQGGDAQIADFVAPDLVSPGTRTTLTWRSTNPGPGTIANVYYSMWLSVDEIGGNGEPGERVVFTDQYFTGELDPGDSENESRTYDIPSDVVDGDYFFVLVADPQDEIDETVSPEGESNNVFATRPQAADLIVADIVIPSGVRIGDEIQLSWTLQNAGDRVATGPWTDEIIFSTNEIAGDSDDVVFDTLAFPSLLNPGQQITRGRSFIVPSSAAGTEFVIIRTDSGNTVQERREDNNDRSESFIPTGPDLFVAAASLAQSSISLLDQLEVGWDSGNQDTAAALAPWVERVYLSSDPAFSPGTDLLLGTFEATINLLPATQAQRSLSLTLPQDGSLAPGNYFVFIDLDSEGQVVETAEGNNTSEPLVITITEAISPNLVASMVSGPSKVPAGGMADVTWSVMNTGNSSTVGTWVDSVRLSLDAAIGGDIELGRVTLDQSLAPGESYTETLTVTVPQEFAGTRRFVLATDADDDQVEFNGETDNVVIADQPVEVRLPDILASTFEAPSSAIGGSDVQLRWVGVNAGGADAVGPWVDRIYVSTNSTLDSGDTLIEEFAFGDTLVAGSSYERIVSVTIPENLPGNRNLLLVLDATNAVPEMAGETNNLESSPIEIRQPPTPDLVIVSVMPPSNGVLSGSLTEVTFDVRNDGTGATTVPTWTDEVYLSLDSNFDASDTRIGTMTNPLFLPPGQSYRQRVQFTLPSDQAGQFWIIARADRSNQVAESNESNNLAVAGPFTVELEPQPDLQVSSVNAPSLAFSGEPLSVTWTEVNSTDLPGTGGPTDASNWSSRIFLSDNQSASITPGDTQIGTVSSGQGSPLAPGASFTLTREVTLPTIISGDFFIKVEADSNDRVSEFGFEGNNIGVSDETVSITQTPPVDLVATALSATGEALPGHAVTLNYEAANFGAPPQSSISWVDAIYLSADGTFDPETDTRIATVNRSANQSDIEPYAPTTTARLDNDLPAGSYTLFVRVDDDNTIFEGTDGEANNVFQAGTALVVEARFADLQPVLTGPTGEAFPPGRTVDISWIVTNQGDAITPVDSWFDAVLFSTDDVVDTSDQTLASVDRSGVLPIGANYSREAAVELPLAEPGSYFLILVSDRGDAVFEGPGDTESNTSIIPIEISDVAADLVASSANSPSTGIASRPITVTWTVTNQGPADTNRTTWIDIVEIAPEDSPTSVIASATSPHEGVLAPTGSYSGSANVTLPISAQGNFIARVRTDSLDRVFEQSEANNESMTTAFTVTLPDDDGDGEPDIANLVAAAPTGPSMAQTGDSITVSWSVSNTGDGTTSANQWTDTVFLSTDAMLSGEDITLGSRSRIGALNSGSSYNASINVTIPGSVVPGDYFFIVQTDTGATVFENGLTADNIATTSVTVNPFAAPNLVAVAVSTDSEIATGQFLEITWSARNDGEGAPRETNWSDAVWLSRDQFLGGNDIRLGLLTRSGTLAPGETYEQTTSFRVPSGIAGPYFVLAQIDGGSRVNEDGREDDNIVAGFSLIDVTIPDPADLVVASVSPPSMAMLGEQATFTWEVANADDAASLVTGSWEDSVFLSEDEVWDIDDAFIGRVTTSAASPLDPGMSVTGSITAPVPGVRPGEYFVIVRSDSRNLIPETDDLNNDGVSVGTVSVEATPLTLGVPFAGEFRSGVDRYFQVDVPAGETLRFTYSHDDPNAFTELYVAFERVPMIGDFDFIYSSPGTSSQQVAVPSSQSGTYFAVARTSQASSAGGGTILVETVPFSFASVFPESPGASVVTFIIEGGRLTELDQIHAEITGSTELITPLSVSTFDNALVAVVFDLTGLDGEEVHIAGSSANGASASTVPLQVDRARHGPIDVRLEGLVATRPGDSLSGLATATNFGNVDLLGYELEVIVNAEALRSGSIQIESEIVDFELDTSGSMRIARASFTSPLVGGRQLVRYELNTSSSAPDVMNIATMATPLSGQDIADRYFLSNYENYLDAIESASPIIEMLPESSRRSVRNAIFLDVRDEIAAALDRALPAAYITQLDQRLGRQDGRSSSRGLFPPRIGPSDSGGMFCSPAWVEAVADIRIELCETVFSAGSCGIGGRRLINELIDLGLDELCDLLVGRFCEVFVGDDLLNMFECCVNPCAEGCDFPPRGLRCPFDDFIAECTESGPFDTNFDGKDDVYVRCYLEPLPDLLIDLGFPPTRPVVIEIPIQNCVPLPRATDPNELVGPEGVGQEQWVRGDLSHFYRAYFENLPAATAPAGTVSVSVPLPESAASGSVRLSNIGFGDLVLEVPSNRITLQDSINTMSPQGTPLRVDVFGGVNPSTDPPVAFWVLQAIDESTGEPPLDPFNGFLPPNDPETGSGEGFIDFSLRPAPGVVTGDVIELQAEIIFDNEEPILTNTVFNTIDADAPISTLGALPLATLNPEIPLTFSGTDPAGSGLLGVQVLVSEDNGPLTVFVPSTQDGAAVFEGEAGRVYRFVSQAIDAAGNVEAIATAPSAVVAVPTLELAVESDTGVIGDGVTIDRTPTFEVVSVPFSAVPITINGPTSLAGTIFTDARGRGSYTVPSGNGLLDGIYAVATDNAGVIVETMIQVDSSSEVDTWSTLAMHGSVGEAGIPVSSAGTTTEPRASGISRIEVAFTAPIDPATFSPSSVVVSGLDAANAPVNLSGVTVSTAVEGSGDRGVITFSPQLPDVARYCITLDGVQDEGGNPVTGETRVSLIALRGDVNGDRRVNGADVTFVRAIRDQLSGATIDPEDPQQIRADVQTDGRVNGADVSFARSFNGNDARLIGDPCPQPLGTKLAAADAAEQDLRADGASGRIRGGLAPTKAGTDGATEPSNPRLDPSRWQDIDTPFLPAGVVVRLDPERFVVGSAGTAPDPLHSLMNIGLDPSAVELLGYEGWIVIEAESSIEASRLRAIASSDGVFTAPVLRDEAGEFLVPTASVVVRFDEGVDAEKRSMILERELGAMIASASAAEWDASLIVIELATPTGEAAINAANRLASQDDVELAEPNFVTFANRSTTGATTVMDIELTEPMALEAPANVVAADRVDVVILDDGVLISPEMQPGLTVYGGVNSKGEPETLADVFGHAVVDGLSSLPDVPSVISIRSFASLNRDGRAATTTLALAEARVAARKYTPLVVVSSAATGYRSMLLDTLDGELTASGIIVIRPAAVIHGGNQQVAYTEGVHGIPLNVLETLVQDSGANTSSSMNTATRIGEITAMLIASELTPNRSRNLLMEAILHVLSKDAGVQSVDSGGLKAILFEVEQVADKLSIDLDRDGRISDADAVLFMQHFGGGDEALDLDGNGIVDHTDLIIFRSRFDMYCDH